MGSSPNLLRSPLLVARGLAPLCPCPCRRSGFENAARLDPSPPGPVVQPFSTNNPTLIARATATLSNDGLSAARIRSQRSACPNRPASGHPMIRRSTGAELIGACPFRLKRFRPSVGRVWGCQIGVGIPGLLKFLKSRVGTGYVRTRPRQVEDRDCMVWLPGRNLGSPHGVFILTLVKPSLLPFGSDLLENKKRKNASKCCAKDR